MVHNHMKLHAFQIDKSIVYKQDFLFQKLAGRFLMIRIRASEAYKDRKETHQINILHF